jgi:small-conductance mechanosensitive channel
MSPDDVPTRLSETFLQRHDHELTALVTVVLVGLLVFGVERAFRRRGRDLALRMTGGDLDPTVQTRLRFVRRFVEASIVVVGIAIAISQFTALDRLAASILASGAIAAATVGFAARQTLANVVAGVMLAVTQPIRIGDLITFEEQTGVVEDIRLTYTFLRTGSDARLIVPNERLAASSIRNDSIVSDTVNVEVELWLSHEADEQRALEAIAGGVEDAAPAVSAVTHEGVLLTVSGAPAPPRERPRREQALRAACLRALRQAGLR